MHLSQTDALFGYACAKLRPQWDGVKVSALQEAIYLATTPQSAALLCLMLVALWRRNLWITLSLCAIWMAWAAHIILDNIGYAPLSARRRWDVSARRLPTSFWVRCFAR